MRELKSLRDCLFECFAYTDFRNPQNPERLWAIQEGIERANQQRMEWRMVTAQRPRVCAGCLAMILFFKQVEDLPPYMKTHWDVVEQRAVFLKPEDAER